jgi:hypothetical protein
MISSAWVPHFLVWVLYPAWLVAGAGDYLCHRRTHIEETSGTPESWLHVAQFFLLFVALLFAVAFRPTVTTLVFVVLLTVLHSVISYVDVSYTIQHRYISPIEQLVHSFLDVIPLVAAALIVVLYWNIARENVTQPVMEFVSPSIGAAALLGSFVVLAGLPIAEELWRTHRAETHLTE